ncbi:MAG: hypothetical protein A2114_00940 [Candidatus Vogelbacteria bacterium GWA1_51_14]|uniref:Uncharacterized protein n=1 Tax=Candidatus Vogelbacteria bacterium GWA1_51_14 TaxID=1802435 RepID=A0A1G2QBF2_9BACT|nr:MAG: hypothetical protein A2114_00940 [Candidatus Vogelbacteria bacterium GWA1_51_14]
MELRKHLLASLALTLALVVVVNLFWLAGWGLLALGYAVGSLVCGIGIVLAGAIIILSVSAAMVETMKVVSADYSFHIHVSLITFCLCFTASINGTSKLYGDDYDERYREVIIQPKIEVLATAIGPEGE